MPATFAIPTANVIAGQLITAALWNAEFANIYNNFIPAGLDDYSLNDAQMQVQVDPFPGAATSRPTSLQGELERIRFVLAAITGKTYWYQPPDATVATLKAQGDITVPLGGVIDFVVATPPNTNFKLANGAAISRTTYAGLFALIGTTFGAGDGSTTFNLPNFTDRVAIAAGNLYSPGATGGAASQTPVDAGHTHPDAHTHGLGNHTHSTPNHQHVLGHDDSTTGSGGFGSPGNVLNITAFPMSSHASGPSAGAKLGTPGGSSGFTEYWSGFQNATENSGSGTSGTPSTNTSDARSLPNTGSGQSNIGSISTLPPYLAVYKMIRVL